MHPIFPISLTLFFFFAYPIIRATNPSSSADIHIFLSFRGTDTRETTASLVYDALNREGFNVFMDDETIRAGHDIDQVIRDAINSSMGAVIIFSRNFAKSEWCLDELVLILDRKKKLGAHYILQPIYDGVDPDDIGEQRGSYGDALAEHKKRYSFWTFNWIQQWKWKNRVAQWTAALTEVAGYKGKPLHGKLGKFMNEMVGEIRQEFIVLGITVEPRPPPSIQVDEDARRILKIYVYNHHGSQFIQNQCNLFVQTHGPIQTQENIKKLQRGSELSFLETIVKFVNSTFYISVILSFLLMIIQLHMFFR